ncbi:MAG: uracil-DNA glycosylase [Massilia sp.]
MKRVSERDAAFLAEMGIGPLWQLRGAPEPEPVLADEAAAPAPVAANSVHPLPPPPPPRQALPPAPPPAPVAVEAGPSELALAAEAAEAAISQMDWAELQSAIASCTRCGACADGRKPVPGAGARRARWLVVAGAATAADEQAGQPLAGEPGKLLDNMLLAVDLSRERDVYVTNLIKCRPASANGGDRAPTAQEAAACRPYLERELALTGASTMLTLGQIAANALLGKPLQEPLAGARGSVHGLGDVALVATLHPAELLRRGADKALAWADLCRAKAAHARPG